MMRIEIQVLKNKVFKTQVLKMFYPCLKKCNSKQYIFYDFV
jgi:hypothetical protein